MNIGPPYRSLPAAVAALLCTLVALLLGYIWTPPIAWHAGEQDALVLHGFHDLETSAAIPFRWSDGASELRLAQVGQPRFALLTIQQWGPTNRPAVPVTIRANGQPVLTTAVQEQRVFQLLVPRQSLGAGDLQVDLLSPTWQPPHDQRLLGVGVAAVGWQSGGGVLPPLQQLWVLPALVLAAGSLLLRLGLRIWPTWLIAAAGGAGLALTAGLRPLEVAPYTHRLLLIVLLAHGGLLLWAALLRAGGHWWQLPRQVTPLGLLLLLGIAYWLMLPFEAVLGLEMGYTVGPRRGTALIGVALLLLLIVVGAAPKIEQRLRRQLATWLLVVSGVAEASYAAVFAFRRSGPDFFILWRAAYDFHLGRPLYKISDVLANHYGHVFKVPPFYGMLFLPFATANDVVVLAFHRGLNVVLYAVTAVLLVRLLRPRIGWMVAIGLVGVVMGLMQPPFDTIAYGQIDIVLLLLLTTALLALRDRRPWIAGVAIALGTLFKLYPAVLLGFLFVRRQWKALAWTIVALALLNAIAIAVMGWHTHVVYVTQVLPNIGGGTSWVENQTINGFLSRLLTGTMRTDPIHDPTLDLLTYGIFALVTGASLLLALIGFDRRSSTFAVQFSIFTVVMVMVVPAAWMHYQTITILAFVALGWHAADRPLRPGQAVAIALAFALIAFGNQWSFFDGTRNPGLPALALSYKGYGLVLLWTIMSSTIWSAATIPLSRRALADAAGKRSDRPPEGALPSGF